MLDADLGQLPLSWAMPLKINKIVIFFVYQFKKKSQKSVRVIF